ncbi:uncharacterized protein [Physcomitrium patens]|uniref:uncharacterized protein isoform X3 n=1 Tax=Physcomitrium patens TaxID=3218 RepID=UPI000D154CB5|nr:uncharacterized protein LOC112284661 isoform X3 [Physcomitrium patens]|eukprot:XP_024380441.1 uncharacterized protein LOC112284661 isoform X3 [Physcomitrella patens]
MTVSSSASLVSSPSSVKIRDGGRRILPVGFGLTRACITSEKFGSSGKEAETDAGVSTMRASERGSGYLPPRFSVAPMMDWTNNHFRTIARLMSKHAWLYTEMVVDDTINYQQDNLDMILKFPESHHPIVLQLGGCNPEKLFRASQLASLYGYDEINLNCGCPSDNVTGRSFGAALMLEPELVGQCVTAIAKGSPGTPVSVKCRIGVDDFDSYDFLHNFIRIVSSTSPTKHFIIHARKAVLKGLSPDENRRIPPLKYDYVFALMRDFPNLKFTLNGGVVGIHQVNEALNRGVFGVMLGRTAYNSPWSVLANVDRVVYGDMTPVLTRRQILEKYVVYGDAELHRYGYKKPGIRQIAQGGAPVWEKPAFVRPILPRERSRIVEAGSGRVYSKLPDSACTFKRYASCDT